MEIRSTRDGVLLLLLALAVGRSRAQNLIPNPSFEENTACPYLIAVPCTEPNPYDPVALAVPWQRPTCSSSDYYHACATLLNYSVPANFQGYQEALSGEAYVGIWANSNNPQDPWHEYVNAPLLEPLLPGVEYEAGMHVSRGAEYDDYNDGCDRLGMFFSIGPPIDTVGNDGWQLEPHVQSTPGVVLGDTAGWTLISGTFIANGGEDHVTIGNFFSMQETMGWGYYYIDDVYLRMSPPIAGIADNARDARMTMGPNPMVEFTELRCTRPGVRFQEVAIFDAVDHLMRRLSCAGCTAMRVERGDLAPGWYSLQARFTDGVPEQRTFVVTTR